MSLIITLLGLEEDNAARDTFVRGVGTLLNQRTVERGTGGTPVGTFTDKTSPTYQQVLDLMWEAAREIDVDLGHIDQLPAELADHAQSLLRFRTAMLVELTYFAEQVATGRSAYDKYADIYKTRLVGMRTAVTELAGGGQLGPADNRSGPVFSFPPAPCHDELLGT